MAGVCTSEIGGEDGRSIGGGWEKRVCKGEQGEGRNGGNRRKELKEGLKFVNDSQQASHSSTSCTFVRTISAHIADCSFCNAVLGSFRL